jgi:TMEM175 potassium channel family protein
VFAIAITLLVLEIHIDPEDFDHLWKAIADEWPSYLAYVTSFLTVGGVWLAHHRLFSHLRYIDPHLMRLNILLLMVAAFLPFPTALLAEAFDASRDAGRAAVVVYGVTAGLIEALMGAAWRYAGSQPALLHDDVPPPRAAMQRHGVPAFVYGAGIVVGVIVFPRLGAILYLLVAARAVLFPAGVFRLTIRN